MWCKFEVLICLRLLLRSRATEFFLVFKKVHIFEFFAASLSSLDSHFQFRIVNLLYNFYKTPWTYSIYLETSNSSFPFVRRPNSYCLFFILKLSVYFIFLGETTGYPFGWAESGMIGKTMLCYCLNILNYACR